MKIFNNKHNNTAFKAKVSLFSTQSTAPQPFHIQLFRYLIVGGVAFVIDFSILYLLVNYLETNYLLAAAISFISGLVVNYAFSISWVFNQSAESLISSSFLIFLVTGLIGLGLNELLMFSFTQIAGLVYLQSKIITVPVVLFWNFISRKYLVNRK